MHCALRPGADGVRPLSSLRVRSPRSRRGWPKLVLWRCWRHNGAMPSVQIKDVPDDVHGVLRERAARAHQSLQEYLLSRLIADASEPTLEEVLERAAGREGGKVSFSAAVRHVRAERDRR
jgi:antitoxin FitA